MQPVRFLIQYIYYISLNKNRSFSLPTLIGIDDIILIIYYKIE